MRFVKKAAVSMAAVGLLAFGAVAGGGDSAFAATNQEITGCDANFGALALGLFPNCTAGDDTADNPTSITITINTTSLGALLNAIPGLGEKATWTLECQVSGQLVSVPGSYTVTTTSQSASDTIDLQTAVGSPAPNTCSVNDLTVSTTLALDIGALGLGVLTMGVDATANTVTPGAIYATYPTDKDGAHAAVCADDKGNGNVGEAVQSFQCLSDLADYWVQVDSHQLVHNGDCLTDEGGSAALETCVAIPPNGSGQVWMHDASGAGLLENGNGGCLTAPSAGTVDGTTLKIGDCKSAVGTVWTIPPAGE
jgi:hypothetical protein